MGLTAGERFAGFRIIRPLGAGGMGEVYLVEHPRLPRQEALKVLSPELSQDPEYRQRFAREADLAAKLWHPHIVEIRDRGDSEGQLWISMAYVDGQDAARLLAGKYPAGMPVSEVIPLITAVASALDYAHAQGTLHRDVKPANIFLSGPDGSGETRVLLGDFGIARELADPNGMTATNITLGTLAYAAPEQLNGDPLDGRADQYALAATAYHLLAGTPLFPVTNPVAVISRHLTAAPPKISATHPQLASLDTVLTKALSKDPAARYARCSDFAQALADASAAETSSPPISPSAPTQQAPVPARQPAPPSVPQTTPPRRSRPRWIPAALGILAVVIPGLLLWAVSVKPWGRDAPDQPSDPVNTTTAAAAGSNTTAPPTSVPSSQWAPPRSDPDLDLDVPISRPACDGTGVVVLDSADTPGQYREDIARALANNPGASYLRTDLSCPSLRQSGDEGYPIYAVYRPAGRTTEQLCAAIAEAGPGTYGRWLDNTSDPDSPVICPTKKSEVVDVDPSTLVDPETPELHLWAYSQNPLRECGIYSADPGVGKPLWVWCAASFPPGTPPVTNAPFRGPPNLVRIAPPKGPEFTITEGSRIRGRVLEPNSRVTVGEFSCTTLANNGVECQAPTGRFRIEDGLLVSPSNP